MSKMFQGDSLYNQSKPAETAGKAEAETLDNKVQIPDSMKMIDPLKMMTEHNEHIQMVMEHTDCTRGQAIDALRECNDDPIQAVMKIQES